jgi:multiple sugar transport system ATP-binding protein
VAGFIGSPPMNLGMGRVTRLGDGLALKFGVATLALHPAVVEDHPALKNWLDRDIAVGVRSEDMEDANLVRGGAPENSTVEATVGLTEALGSEIVVHFDLDVPKVVTEDTKLLEHDSGADDTGLATNATRFVASFAPRSRVRIGDQIRVVVDTERLHFFDPSTGLAVRD